MSRLVFVLAVGLVLAVVSDAAVQSLEKQYNMVARCSGDEEVPRTTTSNRRCIALVTISARTLSVKVYHNYDLGPSANNATAAHIHGGAWPGETAGVIFTLDTTTNPMVLLTDISSGQESDLLAGRWYINMHTAANPAGDIRGQIIGYNQMVTILTTGNENPNPQNALTAAGATPADIWGYMLTDYSDSTNELRYTLWHNVAGLSGAHFHGNADPGNNAGVQYTIPEVADMNTVHRGVWQLTDIQEGFLNAGMLYVNLHNATAPSGVIRGNLHRQPHFVVELLPQHQTPEVTASSSGAGVFQFFPGRTPPNRLDYQIVHTATPSNTGSHIHMGPPGVDGAVLCTLQNAQVSSGTCNIAGQGNSLNALQTTFLMNGSLYVNIHTLVNANGEIRGQIIGLQDRPVGGFGSGASIAAEVAAPVAVFTIVVLVGIAVCVQCKKSGSYCFTGKAYRPNSPASSSSNVKPSNVKPAKPVAKAAAVSAVTSSPVPNAVPTKLPPGWTQHENETGYTYYFHEETGQSSWEPPPGSTF